MGRERDYASIVNQFLRFAAAQTLPVTVDRGSEMAPVPLVKDKKKWLCASPGPSTS